MTDPNVDAVCSRLQARAERGLAKYGVTTERGDLSLVQWLQHAQDEAMDLAIYLERCKKDVAELVWRADTLRQACAAKEGELEGYRK
jgi:hypothetical protein